MPDGFQRSALILQEVTAGLTLPQKQLPAKLFYDAEGCRLFGEITRLPEYYLTRTELALLAQIRDSLPLAPGCTLVEYGASDEVKALAVMDRVGASTYVPIDIAAGALDALQTRLAHARPSLRVDPVVADFLQPLTLPASDTLAFGFFPGSTIGNLTPEMAVKFLQQARQTLGEDAYFLVGVDLRKKLSILLPAYNDAQGVTAAFNRNILVHVNRLLGADFDPTAFDHCAIWDEDHGRIEMHLRSRADQVVTVAGIRVVFTTGETIHTENSYKHTLPGFQSLATQSGWRPLRAWTDPQDLYSIHLLGV